MQSKIQPAAITIAQAANLRASRKEIPDNECFAEQTCNTLVMDRYPNNLKKGKKIMTWFLLVLLCIICWSATDLFNKKGSDPEDKLSHLKFLVWMGLILGGFSVLLLPLSESKTTIFNLIYKYRDYMPFAISYVLALMCGIIGARYLDISVVSPLENIDGAIAGVVLFFYLAITGTINDITQQFTWLDPIGFLLIVVGTVLLGIQEQQAKAAGSHKAPSRNKLGAVAFIFPFIYNIFDAASMVLEGALFQADNGEAVGEFDFLIFEGAAFFIMGIAAWLFLLLVKKTVYNPFRKGELVKAGAALTEGLGNILFTLAIAKNPVLTPPVTGTYFIATILGAKLFLKEKLTKRQYFWIFVLSLGLVLLGISELLK